MRVLENPIKQPMMSLFRPLRCSVHFQSTHNTFHLLFLELLRILVVFQTLQAKACLKSRKCPSKLLALSQLSHGTNSRTTLWQHCAMKTGSKTLQGWLYDSCAPLFECKPSTLLEHISVTCVATTSGMLAHCHAEHGVFKNTAPRILFWQICAL